MRLADRVSRISASATLEVSKLAAELRSQGVDVISFAAGEPDLAPPDIVVEAARRAADEKASYTLTSGLPSLKAAIIESFATDFGVDYSMEEVNVGCGGKGVLFHSLLALVDPGDEVIIPRPYWVSYPEMVKAVGGEPVLVDRVEEEGFQLTADGVSKSVTDRTRVIIIDNPSNPTGAVMSEKNIKEIGELALEKEIWLLVDECYNYFIYDEIKHVTPGSISDEIRGCTIVAGSLSKTFAIPGWRVGYGLGPVEIIGAVNKLSGHTISHTSTLSQYAAVVALKEGRSAIDEMLAVYDARRELVLRLIKEIPGIFCAPPEGAFYAWIKVSDLYTGEVSNSSEFAKYLLKEAGIAVVPGIGFGDERYIRFSYTQPEDVIEEGFNRIGEAVAVLRK